MATVGIEKGTIIEGNVDIEQCETTVLQKKMEK